MSKKPQIVNTSKERVDGDDASFRPESAGWVSITKSDWITFIILAVVWGACVLLARI